MWPAISGLRIASACSAASSGVSANLTPPAFIRPPVSTWDLMTTGPPISSAAARACSGVVQKPYLVTGMPASSTILRASYSKNLIGGAPYTANRNNARNVTYIRTIIVLGLLGALGLLVTGCGGGTDVDFTKASETVRASLESKGEGFGAPIENVDCPQGVKVEPGLKFECTVRYPDG